MSAAESRAQYDRIRTHDSKKGSARFGDLFKKFAHCNLFTISVHSLKKISLIYATHEKNPFGIKLHRICDSLLILNDNGVSRGQ